MPHAIVPVVALSAAALVGVVLALAPGASAQDPEPIQILDYEVGGYLVEATVNWARYTNPNPEVPGTRVESNLGSLPLDGFHVDRIRICHVDEDAEAEIHVVPPEDYVRCRETFSERAGSPCEDFRAQIRDRPAVGALVDGAITTAASTLDGAMDGQVLPALGSAEVRNARWGAAATRLTTACEGATQPIEGPAAVRPSGLIVQVSNPSVCLNRNACPGEIDVDDQVRQDTERQEKRLETFACGFRGPAIGCRGVVDEEAPVQPFAVLAGVVNGLPNHGVISYETNLPDSTTPGVTVPGYELATDGVASCVAPGVPGEPDRVSRVVPYLLFGVTPTGSDLPVGAPREVDATLVATAAASTDAMLDLVAYWEREIDPARVAVVHAIERSLGASWPFAGYVFGPASPVEAAPAGAPPDCHVNSPPPPDVPVVRPAQVPVLPPVEP